MNKGRLIWGVILLALAILLTALNFTLPEEELIFMVGDTNMSYLPPVVLGITGILLLIFARQRIRG